MTSLFSERKCIGELTDSIVWSLKRCVLCFDVIPVSLLASWSPTLIQTEELFKTILKWLIELSKRHWKLYVLIYSNVDVDKFSTHVSDEEINATSFDALQNRKFSIDFLNYNVNLSIKS